MSKFIDFDIGPKRGLPFGTELGLTFAYGVNLFYYIKSSYCVQRLTARASCTILTYNCYPQEVSAYY